MSQKRHAVTLFLYDWAIDEDAKEKIVLAESRKIRVISAALGAGTAVAAADTNYNTFSLMNGSTTIASLANGPVSGGTTIPKGALASMTVVASAAEVAANAVLTLESVKEGNGQAVADLSLVIVYEYVD